MLGLGKKRRQSSVVDDEYLALKETIWNLKLIAGSLQETANEFEASLENLKRLREKYSHATPN